MHQVQNLIYLSNSSLQNHKIIQSYLYYYYVTIKIHNKIEINQSIKISN